MEVFNLIIDEKVLIWERTFAQVEAKSLEEAIEKCKNHDFLYADMEALYDTEEYVAPSPENTVTLAIYKSAEDLHKDNPIYTNDINKEEDDIDKVDIHKNNPTLLYYNNDLSSK